VSLWVAFPVVALMAILQTSLVPRLAVGAARPQLVMTWIVCWAVVRGRGEAMPWAIFGGLLLDLLSQMPPGAHLLAMTAVTFLADLGHKVMQGSTALFALAAVFAASLAYGIVLVGVLAVTGHSVQVADTVILNVLPGAVFNLAVLVPIFVVQRALDRRFPVSVLPEW
jgi:rod shape-determining protein MreD